ncbi:MAG: hypothetical protein Q4B28_08055 [bacterium]|nr:hypothetical protein [bacterium]
MQTQLDLALGDNLNTPKLLSEIHTALANPTASTLTILQELEEKVLKI